MLTKVGRVNGHIYGNSEDFFFTQYLRVLPIEFTLYYESLYDYCRLELFVVYGSSSVGTQNLEIGSPVGTRRIVLDKLMVALLSRLQVIILGL